MLASIFFVMSVLIILCRAKNWKDYYEAALRGETVRLTVTQLQYIDDGTFRIYILDTENGNMHYVSSSSFYPVGVTSSFVYDLSATLIEIGKPLPADSKIIIKSFKNNIVMKPEKISINIIKRTVQP